MTTVFLLTGTTSWSTPADWNNAANTVEAVGSGGAGSAGSAGSAGAGGGGGAYAKATNLTLSGSITVAIGAGGGTAVTQFKDASTVVADYGRSGSGTTAGAGGLVANSVGATATQAGGAGAAPGGTFNSRGGGGGGGAGGPSGDGKLGAASANNAGSGGGGGGGSNGGTSTNGSASVGGNSTGGAGGQGTSGAGSGAGGAGAASGNAGNGTDGTVGAGGGGGGGTGSTAGGNGGKGGSDTAFDGTHGCGGGGAGGGGAQSNGIPASSGGGNGGAYGGGGGGVGNRGGSSAGTPAGTGADGLIIINYTPATGIAFDAASNSGYQAAASTYNWSHTCTGSNRYLVVGVAMLSLAQTVTSITYNGIAMGFLGAQNSVTGAARVELWGLVVPSTGSNTIAVTLSGAIASGAGAASYTGVNQSSPTEAFNSAQATNVGAADATVNVTTVADNDWVVDMVATDDATITVGAGNTSRANVTGAGGSGAFGDNNAAKTPAGSVTMSWTNVAALATWSIAGIAIRPVAAANLGRTYDFFNFFS